MTSSVLFAEELPKELAKAEATFSTQKLKLHEQMASHLKSLQDKYTKAGDLESAIKARDMVEKHTAAIAELKPTQKAPNSKVTADNITLFSGNGGSLSKPKPKFKVTESDMPGTYSWFSKGELKSTVYIVKAGGTIRSVSKNSSNTGKWSIVDGVVYLQMKGNPKNTLIPISKGKFDVEDDPREFHRR